MKKELRLLLVEDSELDASLLTNEVKRAGYDVRSLRVETKKDFLSALDLQEWDLILCDYYLPDFNAVIAVQLLRERELDIPFIVASASVGEETVVETLKAGANDYVMKGSLIRLVPAIERELREATERQQRKRLARESDMLALAIKSVRESVSITDENNTILFVNDSFLKTYQYDRGELIGKNISIVRPEQYPVDEADDILRSTKEGGWEGELPNKRKDGSVFPIRLSTASIKDQDGRFIALIGVAEDITEGKRAAEELTEERNLLRALMDNTPDHIYFKDTDSHFIRISKALAERFGLSDPEQTVDKTDFDFFTEEHARPAYEGEQEIIRTGQPLVGLEEKETWPDGRETWVSTTKVPLRDTKGQIIGTFGISRDITDRRRAEEALRESEERYKTLFAGAREAIFIAEAESGIILDCNEAACSLIERPKEELIGKHQSTLHPPDEMVGDFSASFRRHLTNDPGDVLNARVVTKSGVFKDVEIKANVLELRGKKIIQGFFSDTTARKLTEEALRHEKGLMDALMDNIPESIYFKDRQCHLVRINRKMMQSLNLDEMSQAIGKTDVELYGEEFGRKTLASDRKLMESREPIIGLVETRQLEDGQTNWTLTTKVPLCDASGQIMGLVGITREINELMRTQEALRDNEQRLKVALTCADIAVFNQDKNLRYTWMFNPQLGFLPDEVIGKTDADLFPQSNLPVVIAMKENVLRSGIGAHLEVPIAFDHEEVVVLLSVEPLRDSTGMIIGLTGAMSDITKRKRADERQKALETRLAQAQKMESLGTLAGGIAHDFNNILGIILGHLSIIRGPDFDEARRAASAETVSNAVERGTNLVRQILTFARKTGVTLVPVNVNETIKEIRKMVAEMFPKSIEFAMDLEKGLPFVIIDSDQLHQALLNLCVNARDSIIDAQKEGSVKAKITLKTELVTGKELRKRFPEATTDQYVAVSVTDTGAGMDENARERIFEPFFTTKEKGKGTGLGLAVVYGVVQSAHGIADVQSTRGRGSVFTLYLPVPMETSLSEPRHEKRHTRVPGGTETLLIVEDEESLLEILRMSLQNEGYRVVTSIDGREALERFTQHQDRIDLVITDLGLPKISGETVLRELKKMKPSVKVIVASGYIEPDERSELLKAGADDIILKPYHAAELLEKVRSILDAQ